jgi:hypothetical protein
MRGVESRLCLFAFSISPENFCHAKKVFDRVGRHRSRIGHAEFVVSGANHGRTQKYTRFPHIAISPAKGLFIFAILGD